MSVSRMSASRVRPDITVLHDHGGSRYKVGAGMKIYVNGKLAASHVSLSRLLVPISKLMIHAGSYRRMENYAANIKRQGYPITTASFTDRVGCTYQAVDGRRFYDDIPSNRWSNWESPHEEDWFAVDFGRAKTVNSVNLYAFSGVIDGKGGTDCLTRMNVQYNDGANWKNAENQASTPAHCAPNDVNKINFHAIKTKAIQVFFTRNKAKSHFVGITELEIWAEWPQTPVANSYEFKDGIITDANMDSSATASSNSYVGQLDRKSSNVELSGIYAESTGNYVVRAYGGKPAKQNLEINMISNVVVNYPTSKNGWAHFDESAHVEVTILLLKGDNALISHQLDYFVELDKIHIVHKF